VARRRACAERAGWCRAAMVWVSALKMCLCPRSLACTRTHTPPIVPTASNPYAARTAAAARGVPVCASSAPTIRLGCTSLAHSAAAGP
jgi:hypothetical protein